MAMFGSSDRPKSVQLEGLPRSSAMDTSTSPRNRGDRYLFGTSRGSICVVKSAEPTRNGPLLRGKTEIKHLHGFAHWIIRWTCTSSSQRIGSRRRARSRLSKGSQSLRRKLQTGSLRVYKPKSHEQKMSIRRSHVQLHSRYDDKTS